jgi:hypothetical protein
MSPNTKTGALLLSFLARRNHSKVIRCIELNSTRLSFRLRAIAVPFPFICLFLPARLLRKSFFKPQGQLLVRLSFRGGIAESSAHRIAGRNRRIGIARPSFSLWGGTQAAFPRLWFAHKSLLLFAADRFFENRPPKIAQGKKKPPASPCFAFILVPCACARI